MKNGILILLLSMSWIIFPAFLFARGKAESKCELSIENKTGSHITQIMIVEAESTNEPVVYNMNMRHEDSTTIKVNKGTLYNIILINSDERQYVLKRQAWNDDNASLVFYLGDIEDRNAIDKLKRVFFWPKYRKRGQ